MPRLGRTDIRSRLLVSVSAVALVLGSQTIARAADLGGTVVEEPARDRFAAANEVWVAVEGRYNMYPGDVFGVIEPAPWAEVVNGDPDDGWSGVLEIGARPAGNRFDFVGRLAYGQGEGDGSSYSSRPNGYNFASFAETEEQHIVADFEVGRQIGVGLLGGETRVHAGIRFVHFDAEMDTSAYYGGGSGGGPGYGAAFITRNNTITGIGPRIGIDYRAPIANNFFVDLSAAGAAIYAKRDTDASRYAYYYYFPPIASARSSSETDWIWNAEASAGLTYQFGAAEATVGYRVDAFWDLYEGTNGDMNDRITHGPFAKLKIKFGGG